MHRDNCSGTRSDLCPDQAHIDIERPRFGIHQHRCAAAEDNHADRGGKGHGGGDDLVPLFDLQSQQGQMQTGGGGTERYRKGGADIGPECLLKALDLGAGSNPAGTERIDDLVDLGILDGGGGKREKC